MLPWLHGHPAHQRHILVVGDEVTVQFDPEGQKVGDLLDRIGQDSFIGARMERDNVVAVPRTTLYMKVCDISESHRRTGIATLKWEGASRLSSTQPSSTRVPTPPPPSNAGTQHPRTAERDCDKPACECKRGTRKGCL